MSKTMTFDQLEARVEALAVEIGQPIARALPAAPTKPRLGMTPATPETRASWDAWTVLASAAYDRFIGAMDDIASRPDDIDRGALARIYVGARYGINDGAHSNHPTREELINGLMAEPVKTKVDWAMRMAK